jgi:elongation factor P--(R)-beta-lysine ligase
VRAVEMRRRVERGIREFFEGRGFVETRTPLLVRSPGMEPHIRPYRVDGGAYLPTSPEFAMKRLLAGGLERIFQLAPAFRVEPVTPTHLPEFTLLEWYRAHAGAADIMADAEELVAELATGLHGAPRIPWQGRTIDVATPWPRLRVRDLFAEHAGVDLVGDDLREACARLGIHAVADDGWDDLYFRIWLARVEPRLPSERAVFVTRYPASQAALSVIVADGDGSRWAERFEIYAGGLELANAFEELTDPVEQRRRFEADMALRARVYGPSFPPSPIDEDFLGALAEGMPPSGGIALGVDRLVMLMADEPDIRHTVWLLPA